MNNRFRIQLTDSPDLDDVQVIRNGLDEFNASKGAPVDWKPLILLLRDEHNIIVGGLTGGTYWGWLFIGRLWLADSLHYQGHGSRILAEAEKEALRRNCHHVYLDTQDFQALPFYQKHGYIVYGELEDIPLGHTRYSLKKKILQTNRHPKQR